MVTSTRFPCRLILPIRLGLDPMQRLLVASFKGDPEFDSIEPQVFDDSVNGKGMRVLRYRKDGRVDVYWQPGVRVDRSTLTLGAGIGDFAEASIEPAHFEITQGGMDLHLAFKDAQDRRVDLRIREEGGGPGFPLLAPIGADITQPLQLFLVYMGDIKLVRRAGSLFQGRIGDRALHPATLPILMGGRRVIFTRYVADPVIATLNPPMDRPLVVELAEPGSLGVDGMSLTVSDKGRVTGISAGSGQHRAEVEFDPGFPNLLDLGNDQSAAGRWSIRVAGVPITAGAYQAARQTGEVAVAIDVTEHWKPSGLPLSMEILTRLVRKFRAWPSTYRWRGTVKLGASPTLSGRWERTAAP